MYFYVIYNPTTKRYRGVKSGTWEKDIDFAKHYKTKRMAYCIMIEQKLENCEVVKLEKYKNITQKIEQLKEQLQKALYEKKKQTMETMYIHSLLIKERRKGENK
jgi:hypothetical protein